MHIKYIGLFIYQSSSYYFVFDITMLRLIDSTASAMVLNTPIPPIALGIQPPEVKEERALRE
jgi:hypothetical protein